MGQKTIIGVVGSTGSAARKDAKAFGKLAAAEGWVVLTGGRNSGVMQAALQGAKDPSLSTPGLTVGLIPNTDSEIASEVDIAIITDLNNARNNLVGSCPGKGDFPARFYSFEDDAKEDCLACVSPKDLLGGSNAE